MKLFKSIQFRSAKPGPSRSLTPGPSCKSCAHFQNDPAHIEKVYPGLTTMSSGFASVRDQDGLCDYHQLYLSARDSCPAFRRAWQVPGGYPADAKSSTDYHPL